VLVVDGKGSQVRLSDGRNLIDGTSGLWCVNIGHGRADLAQAAFDQMSAIAFTPTFGGFSNVPAIRLAERLALLAPGDLDSVMLTSGGSEANETAFKLARFYWAQLGQPSKSVIVGHDRGYHGLSLGATTATGLKPYHQDFGPLVTGFAYAPSPYCYRCPAEADCNPAKCPIDTGAEFEAKIHQLGADNVAAIIVEPVLGTGGVIVPPAGYLRAIREICSRLGVLMIADEVITGFGRTGRWFGVEHDDVVPDMLTFAKGVTSGYIPLGGVMIGTAVRKVLTSVDDDHPLMHGFTYSGHPASCAVALANIRAIEDGGLVQQAEHRGHYLKARLEQLRSLSHVGDVRGLGLMTAIEVVAERSTRKTFAAGECQGIDGIVALARNFGLLTRRLLDDIFLLAPPLIITEDECDRAADALERAIGTLRMST
jgi:putrescine aminotransferase